MGWLVLGLRPAVENAACEVTQKRCARPEVGMSFTHADGREVRPKTEVRAHEGVDRSRSPQSVRVAVAAVNEVGELVEGAPFSQNLEKA